MDLSSMTKKEIRALEKQQKKFVQTLLMQNELLHLTIL